MGQVLKGEKLNQVRTQLEDAIKQSMDSEIMNFLAFLTYIHECNKNMSLNSPNLAGWLGDTPINEEESI